ncbi:MAG TPA: glycosyltransferase family 2 protein [Methylomirabilota bacterium]|nr:glycosyltransferase family 2 protein [Methylomirabilota bacterium]
MTSLAVIVPVYNELGNIDTFYERSTRVLDGLGGISWQIVFVNDGSTDGSYERIRELGARDERVKVISLSRNFGYHAVLLAGLSMVIADRYVMIDVDCEDPPELLNNFHAALAKGADIAYGIRSNRIEPVAVTFGRRVFYYLNRWIADSDIVVWMAEFAMVTRQVRDAILVPRTTYVFLRAEIGYVGFVRVGIPYLRAARTSGKTHYNVWRMTRFAVSGVLAGSTFPLRLTLYVAALLGMIFPLIVLLGRLDPAATVTLAMILTFYFILVTVPTLALYLARTYKNGVGRPVFVIDANKTVL